MCLSTDISSRFDLLGMQVAQWLSGISAQRFHLWTTCGSARTLVFYDTAGSHFCADDKNENALFCS